MNRNLETRSLASQPRRAGAARTALVLCALVAILLPSDLQATLCALDDAPGATVLFPWFEVDVSDASCQAATQTRKTTLFSIRNTTEVPALTFVTVWTDWGVPILGFNVYLAGFGEQTIDLSTVLCEGTISTTGSAVTPHGPASAPPAFFPGCNATSTVGAAPVYEPGVITPEQRAHLKALLTGQQSQITGLCASSGAAGTDIAIGYVTVDSVTACLAGLPSEAQFYTNGTLSYSNNLQGELELRSANLGSVQRVLGVSLEADPSLTGITGGPTFYGRYNTFVLGFEYSDGREPLPTTWGVDWRTAGNSLSEVVIWRESNHNANAVPCFAVPSWYPLTNINLSGAGPVLHFDDDGTPAIEPDPLPGIPLMPSLEFPNVAQKVVIEPKNGTPFQQGWNYLNLQNDIAPTASNSLGQALVVALPAPTSGGGDLAKLATALDGQCPVTTTLVAQPGPLLSDFAEKIFSDGFESGSTSAWSNTVF